MTPMGRHQGGDEVLHDFARVLKRRCRPCDQVGCYGEEEF